MSSIQLEIFQPVPTFAQETNRLATEMGLSEEAAAPSTTAADTTEQGHNPYFSTTQDDQKELILNCGIVV